MAIKKYLDESGTLVLVKKILANTNSISALSEALNLGGKTLEALLGERIDPVKQKIDTFLGGAVDAEHPETIDTLPELVSSITKNVSDIAALQEQVTTLAAGGVKFGTAVVAEETTIEGFGDLTSQVQTAIAAKSPEPGTYLVLVQDGPVVGEVEADEVSLVNLTDIIKGYATKSDLNAAKTELEGKIETAKNEAITAASYTGSVANEVNNVTVTISDERNITANVDLSAYVKATDLVAIDTETINQMFAGTYPEA